MKSNDIFYKYYDAVFSNKEYTDEFNYIIESWGKYGNPLIKPRILDVGCGTGNHTFEFLKSGFDITGIDIDKNMIDIAISKYGKRNKIFKLADVTTKKFRKKFQLVYSYFFVVNYIDDIDYLRKYFTSIFNLLDNNGIFAFDLVNGNATSLSPPIEKKIESVLGATIVKGKLLPIYDARYNIAEYHYNLEIQENKKKVKVDYSINQTYWNPFVIIQILKKSGFKNVHVFKALTFDPSYSNQDYKLSFACVVD